MWGYLAASAALLAAWAWFWRESGKPTWGRVHMTRLERFLRDARRAGLVIKSAFRAQERAMQTAARSFHALAERRDRLRP